MTEDAKVLDDGPAFEPTKRLRGLAAVEGFAVSVAGAAMSGNGKDVSSRGKSRVQVDHSSQTEQSYEGQDLHRTATCRKHD